MKWLSNNVIILLIILALLFAPIIFIVVKDWLGLNSNKFYGDELNKKTKNSKTTKFDEQEKSSFLTELFRNR
ncbi:hypothetical protein [Sutcliffiella halmapala]|uniref:hypothetical protein n=1 Tax=Sutcliffiella halmapala TaxID=79882 RepID=UPI001115E990|nr:hypothetical protein [Sutcliffiella halmapala]